MGFYGAYNYSGLVSQVSGFITVSVSLSLLSVSVRRVLAVISTLLDLGAEESRVLKYVKPPRCGEASRKPRALSWKTNPCH